MADITVASTTDTQEQVAQAAGIEPEKPVTEEKPNTETVATDAVKPEAAAAKPGEAQDDDSDDDEPGAENAPEKPEGGWQRRVNKLTARNKLQEGELQTLRERLTRLEGAATKPADTPGAAAEGAATAAEDNDPKPTPEKFTADGKTYEDYVEALGRWAARQEQAKLSKVESEKVEQQRLQQTYDAYNTRVAEARSKFDDFDAVVGREDIEIPRAAQVALIEIDNGPEIAYHLGKNPDVAKKLCTMSAARAVVEIGRLSAQLAGGASAPVVEATPKPRPASTAPAPIAPVGGTARTAAKPLDELDYKEYKKARAAGRTQ